MGVISYMCIQSVTVLYTAVYQYCIVIYTYGTNTIRSILIHSSSSNSSLKFEPRITHIRASNYASLIRASNPPHASLEFQPGSNSRLELSSRLEFEEWVEFGSNSRLEHLLCVLGAMTWSTWSVRFAEEPLPADLRTLPSSDPESQG